ncbi:MAG: polyphenol oxidase family protein [Thermoleophilaceae bacterium]
MSRAPYDSLNLGILTDDDPVDVHRNRDLLSAEVGLDRTAMGLQVHGADLATWTGPPAARAPLQEVDGHVTDAEGLGLLVLAADCLPVALAAPGRVAMLHCGWRGVAAGILAAGVDAFDAPPAAVIGPGIGRCCFEVGPEVLEAFADVPGAAAGRMLDLRAVVEARLRNVGVTALEHVDLCTSCREDLFFSHRRDGGITGRQGGIVWLS